MDNFFGILQLAFGAYLLYCGIAGKGTIYTNEHIKKGMEELYRKRMRVFSLIIGPSMIATGLVEYLLKGSEYYNAAFYTVWGLNVVGIAALLVVTVRMTDRTRAKQVKKGQSAPRSAFEFDENEK